jgi:hypothetical protein
LDLQALPNYAPGSSLKARRSLVILDYPLRPAVLGDEASLPRDSQLRGLNLSSSFTAKLPIIERGRVSCGKIKSAPLYTGLSAETNAKIKEFFAGFEEAQKSDPI